MAEETLHTILARVETDIAAIKLSQTALTKALNNLAVPRFSVMSDSTVPVTIVDQYTDADGDTWNLLSNGAKQWLSGPAPTGQPGPVTPMLKMPASWDVGDAVTIPTFPGRTFTIKEIAGDRSEFSINELVDTGDGQGPRDVSGFVWTQGVTNLTHP